MNPPVANLPLPVPSPDDRSNALLMHILAIFSGFLVPLLFFIVKRDSPFVKFHSLQALIWYVTYMVIFVVGMLIAFSTMFPPPEKGLRWPSSGIFGFVWLWGMLGWVVNVILGIVHGIKANQGQWACYPLIGKFVLRQILLLQQVS
jgi:uncharacterized protein